MFNPINKILGKRINIDIKSRNYIIREKNDKIKCSECGKYLGKADKAEDVYNLMERHIRKCEGETHDI